MMKLLKPLIILFLTVLLFTSCQRNLGLEGPSGTYLYLNLNLPESGDSEGARFIHSESDELTVSLTYPGEDPIVAEFELNSSNPGPILVEDLKPGTDVLLEISVGLAESDIVLSSASTTLDIVAGANSPASLTLAALTYTIHGTLYNDADQILKDQAIWLEGAETPVMTDANGNFTLSLSTEDLVPDEYMKFSLYVSEITYDIARTNLYLLQNREDFKLKAHPEILLDFTVKCEQYVLPGTHYELWQGYVSDGNMVASGSADANGRIVFQDFDYSYSGYHELLLSYNDTFINQKSNYPVAPGAVVDDIVMEPYVFFTGADNGGNSEKIFRMDGTDTEFVPLYMNLISTETIEGGELVVDYKNNKIYVWAAYDVDSYAMIVLNGWDSTTPDYSVQVITDVFTSPRSPQYSVQQMLLLEDGNLLVIASYGAYLFDTNIKSVSTVWENTGPKGLVFNGAYQESNGNIYALGVDRSGATPEEQKIYQLLINGSYKETYRLSSYNNFMSADSTYSLGVKDFIYLLGAYQWDSKLVSVQPKITTDNTYTNGSVILFNTGSSSLTQSGAPLEEESIDDPFLFLTPIGVLPDNKFYFKEEQDSGETKIFSLEDTNNPVLNLFQSYFDVSASVPNGFLYRYKGYNFMDV